MELLRQSGEISSRVQLAGGLIVGEQGVLNRAGIFNRDDLIDGALRGRQTVVFHAFKCRDVRLAAPERRLRSQRYLSAGLGRCGENQQRKASGRQQIKETRKYNGRRNARGSVTTRHELAP